MADKNNPIDSLRIHSDGNLWNALETLWRMIPREKREAYINGRLRDGLILPQESVAKKSSPK